MGKLQSKYKNNYSATGLEPNASPRCRLDILSRMATEPITKIECAICHKTRETPVAKNGNPRTPRGWKIIEKTIYCPQCKKEKYALRAVTIPIATCEWDTVMPLLRSAWRDGTRCANWLLTEYYQRDAIKDTAYTPKKKTEVVLVSGELVADGEPDVIVLDQPKTAKPARKLDLPLWVTPYLYGEARKQFPKLEPTVLVSIINAVSAKYKASRFDVWRGAASLPVYRDLPMPIPTQNWELTSADNERTFSARINGQRYIFRLRRDGEFHRQHRALDQIIAGTVEAGEAALYPQKKDIMLKIAMWSQRLQKQPGGVTVRARTCADGFLIAVNGESIWRLNADHVQSWIVGAAKHQQRLREDLKAEQRFPKRMREGITSRMAALSEKRSNQLSSWMHEASIQLVNWSRRQFASTLVWDDSYPSMLPKFPWFTFAARIEQKCEVAGIEFIRASDGAMQKSPEPLAKGRKAVK